MSVLCINLFTEFNHYRIVKAVEEVADQLLVTKTSVDIHSRNIAVRAFKTQPHLFNGIDCVSWIIQNQTLLDCIADGSPRAQSAPVEVIFS